MGSEPRGEGETDPYMVIYPSSPPQLSVPAGPPAGAFVRKGLVAGIRESLRQFVASVRAKREERRYARRASVKALETYHQVHARHPELSGKALYGEVIVSEGLDADAAHALIRSAEQSFTEWPIERDLRFQDVVHYMVYEAYMREYRSRHWTLADIGQVVSSVIPPEL